MNANITLPKTAPLITLMVTQLASVVVGLVGEFSGAELTGGQIVAIMGAADFVGIVAALILWAVTVAKREVVEKLLSTGEVVAGQANEVVTEGQHIRELGDPVAVPNDPPALP